MTFNQKGEHNNAYKDGTTVRVEAFCSRCNSKTTKLKKSKRAFCDNKCKNSWQKYGLLGKSNPNYGKRHLHLNIGRKYSDSTRLKLRDAQINNLKYQVFNGLPVMPCVGKYEVGVLDFLEECFNYKILRQHSVAGYFLDGFCPALRLAIEIDEPRHFKDKKYLKNDSYRERLISEELNCSFIRITVGD